VAVLILVRFIMSYYTSTAQWEYSTEEKRYLHASRESSLFFDWDVGRKGKRRERKGMGGKLFALWLFSSTKCALVVEPIITESV
jgi:hypothetical protein